MHAQHTMSVINDYTNTVDESLSVGHCQVNTRCLVSSTKHSTTREESCERLYMKFATFYVFIYVYISEVITNNDLMCLLSLWTCIHILSISGYFDLDLLPYSSMSVCHWRSEGKHTHSLSSTRTDGRPYNHTLSGSCCEWILANRFRRLRVARRIPVCCRLWPRC